MVSRPLVINRNQVLIAEEFLDSLQDRVLGWIWLGYLNIESTRKSKNKPYGWSFEGISRSAGNGCWYLSTVGRIFSAIWRPRVRTDDDVPTWGITCWLISRMATSFRWVNSWNAASMAATWVSATVRSCQLSHALVRSEHTGVNYQEILLLFIIYVANSREQQAGNGILTLDSTWIGHPRSWHSGYTSSPITAKRFRSLKDVCAAIAG